MSADSEVSVERGSGTASLSDAYRADGAKERVVGLLGSPQVAQC
jgi:hypothetical protein